MQQLTSVIVDDLAGVQESVSPDGPVRFPVERSEDAQTRSPCQFAAEGVLTIVQAYTAHFPPSHRVGAAEEQAVGQFGGLRREGKEH